MSPKHLSNSVIIMQAGVTCQHGPAECRLNRVINCAEELSASDAQFMAFLRCLAKAGRGGEAAVDGCAKAAKLSPEDISQCATGGAADMGQVSLGASK